MSRRNNFDRTLSLLEEEGLIRGVRFRVKSGKEATVFACNPGSHLASLCTNGYIAVKVYHPREERGFKNDSVYRDGIYIANTRMRRAVANKSETGRAFVFESWIANEASTLTALYSAGVRVPRLISTSEDAILMDFIGDDLRAAPRLCEIELSAGEATMQYKSLLEMIERMLSAGFVHGDLSPYNLLYFQKEIVIIDVPQAVNAWKNPSASDLLVRDVLNVSEYFLGQRATSVPADPERFARAMWQRFRYGSERKD